VADAEDIRREIAALEHGLHEAVERQTDAQRGVQDLEARRAEAAGRLAIARQAAADFEARLEQRREDLERALEAAAAARLAEAHDARAEAARRAAQAVGGLVAAFEELDAARATVDERVAEAAARGRRAEPVEEPPELERAWERLVQFVQARTDLQLDYELVEAAIASPLGHEIKNLPEHLQAVARTRRAERMSRAIKAPGRPEPLGPQ